MLAYVRIELGDIPDRFAGNERSFYKCIAFAAVMLANYRKYTGYKEIESCGINWEDLKYLGIISNPSSTGAFYLKMESKVTYKQLKKANLFYLDTACLGIAKVTDVLMNRDSMWLYDEESWNEYDPAILTELPKEEQRHIKKKIDYDLLNEPAQSYIDKVVMKRWNRQGKWRNNTEFLLLTPEKQDYFLSHLPADLNEAYKLLHSLSK